MCQLAVEQTSTVDKDGNLRMVLANKDQSPGPSFDRRTVQSHAGQRPVIIFFNNEGDECGGLTFGGKRTADGYDSGAGLTFDQFKQDQVLGIQLSEHNGQRYYGYHVWDQPNVHLSELIDRYENIMDMPDGPNKVAALKEFKRSGWAERLFMGKRNDQLILAMSDSKGRERIRLSIGADDVPRMEFLDENGQVIYSLPPAGPRKEE